MRSVPVNESIPVGHAVASYNDIRKFAEAGPGPFAAIPCVCRQGRSHREEMLGFLEQADREGVVLQRQSTVNLLLLRLLLQRSEDSPKATESR